MVNSSKNINITLVISSLRMGGAERVMSIMANYWMKNGYGVSIISFDDPINDFYKLDPRIRRVKIGHLNDSKNIIDSIKSNYRRIKKIKIAVKRTNPDIVISFLSRTNILVLLALSNFNIPVIVSERTNPTKESIGLLFEILRRYLYPKTNLLVVQTKSISDWAKKKLKISEDKIEIIPNPVDVNSYPNSSSNEKASEIVISMGRLIKSKNFNLLIESFSECLLHRPNWVLYILGEGPERPALEKLIKDKGIEKNVFLLGKVNNPKIYLSKAKIFAFSSSYEGFPNAILEALSQGLPVVSTDCPYGPNEIITNKREGFLVPNYDKDELANKICILMDDEKKRKEMSVNAWNRSKDYSLDNVMKRWDYLVDSQINLFKGES